MAKLWVILAMVITNKPPMPKWDLWTFKFAAGLPLLERYAINQPPVGFSLPWLCCQTNVSAQEIFWDQGICLPRRCDKWTGSSSLVSYSIKFLHLTSNDYKRGGGNQKHDLTGQPDVCMYISQVLWFYGCRTPKTMPDNELFWLSSTRPQYTHLFTPSFRQILL